MSRLNILKDELKTLNYPESMKPINCTLTGLGFFPGGSGNYKNEDCISTKEVMVLGQDFGTAEYVDNLPNGEDEKSSATWRNLLKFLSDCEIKPENCFYTNAIMGVRKSMIINGKETAKMTGKSPAFKDKNFIEQCQKLFLKQLELQKPKVVFVLGKETAHFLSPLSSDLVQWERLGSFSDIDSRGIHTIRAKFDNGIQTTFVLLTHPSFRPANVRRRRFQNLEGNVAELAIVKMALTHQAVN